MPDEKLDGSGYPRGLSGDELSLTARILAAADILEAMTAARPYREPIPVDEVLSELDRDAGTTLDAGCIDALRKWAASSR